MKKIGFLLVVCVCILTPSAARADDGGFWDMLWHWDMKFSGIGTDFHLYCFDAQGDRVLECDEMYKYFLSNPFSKSDARIHAFGTLDKIKQEVNLRVSVMHSYGERVPDTGDDRKVWALKTMGFYNFRFNRRIEAGAGMGTISIFGEDVERGWRPIATASLTIGLGRAFFARVEESYLWGTIHAASLGHPESLASAGPKPNFSITLGVDFRR